MENIENLLEDLDSGIFDDNKEEEVSTLERQNNDSVGPNEQIDTDFESTKREANSKYSSSYAFDIHNILKENRSERGEFSGIKSSWTTNTTDEKTNKLSAPQSVVTGKFDVYAEPTFGLRLINPLVSSQFIQSKMAGKQPVSIGNVAYHLKCGDKNTDWVFAGAVVFKSGLKTSQKGSQYCIWKISDLKHDLRSVTVYLFSKACSELWKLSIGTVVAILNATPFHKDEQVSKDDLTLTVRSADQVMIWGGSRDYGICKAKKKNGDNCTSFINKSLCEFCIYHVKNEYNKFSNQRADLQGSFFGGLTGLRNKVLGKNEVFYGGKSFSALKPAPRNGKVQRRDNQLLNMLPLSTSKKCPLVSKFDNHRLQMLSKESPTDSQIENIKNRSNAVLAVSGETKTTATCKTSSNDKVYPSRLHLLREAGQRKIETGETTRVTLLKPQKKTASFSFATVFSSEDSSTMNTEKDVTKSSAKLNKIKSSPSVKNASDFELYIKPATSLVKTISERMQHSSAKETDKSCEIELQIASPCSSKSLKFSRSLELTKSGAPSLSNKARDSQTMVSSSLGDKTSVPRIEERLESPTTRTRSNLLTTSNPSESASCVPIAEEAMQGKFLEFSSRNDDSVRLNDEKSLLRDGIKNYSTSASQLNINSFRKESSTISASIHERKKNLNKMRAINLMKKQGGLVKSNPNRVKPDLEKKKKLKRKFEQEEEERTANENSSEEKPLSQRFIDLMNATSRHENLVQIAESVEQENYFNKLEKKEQLEEKMLSTYKVPCKAVTCLKCEYKWFSASDLCRAEGHPIKVFETFKRFFKCDNCSNRTVSLEIIPLVNCKNCGNAKWSKAPMIREKIVTSDHQLCIRGDEQKYLNSLSSNVNFGLLVPTE